MELVLRNTGPTVGTRHYPTKELSGTKYMRLYMTKYRKRKPGYLTFRRQIRLGLIPKDSDYDMWVLEYEPRKQHPWLKK